MKWLSGFMAGLIVGAVGVAVYLKNYAPAQVALPPAVVTAEPSGALPVLVPTPMPSAPVSPSVAPPAATPAPSGEASETATAAAIVSSKTTPGSAAPGGQLLIPVAGIKASQLSDTFNQARGTERRHEALDILAQKGTEVYAVADGKLVKFFNSKPGGITVYQFDTTERFAYYYAHLDRYAEGIKEGAMVKRGELLGYVGSTGNADPAAPHLHFAIFELGPEKQWWKGSPINPYPLLAGSAGK